MIPRRLDRLPWSRWHWLVVIGLGITWIPDGFEVTLVGAIASVLTKPETLHLTTHQASSAGTWYLIGACGGALFFGYLTDRLGRKKLFMVTLGVYLIFTVATRSRGASRASQRSASSPAPGSAASTRRSTLRSTS